MTLSGDQPYFEWAFVAARVDVPTLWIFQKLNVPVSGFGARAFYRAIRPFGGAPFSALPTWNPYRDTCGTPHFEELLAGLLAHYELVPILSHPEENQETLHFFERRLWATVELRSRG